MCPTDTTPDPRTMTHTPDEPQFVQPKSDLYGDQARSTVPRPERPGEREMAQRPELPANPEQMAVDIEDEEADPVGGDKPRLADRLKSDSELQRG